MCQNTAVLLTALWYVPALPPTSSENWHILWSLPWVFAGKSFNKTFLVIPGKIVKVFYLFLTLSWICIGYWRIWKQQNLKIPFSWPTLWTGTTGHTKCGCLFTASLTNNYTIWSCMKFTMFYKINLKICEEMSLLHVTINWSQVWNTSFIIDSL